MPMGVGDKAGAEKDDKAAKKYDAAAESRRNTVRHLQELYSVVTGVALTLAITGIVDRQKGTEVVLRFEQLPYFLTYLLTVVPFYHGTLRHLDMTYFEDPTVRTREGALMFDWALLFIQSCLLLGLALFTGDPKQFVWMLVIVLGVDTLWAYVAYLGFSPDSKADRPESKWAVINLITTILLAVVALLIPRIVASE